MRSDHCDVNFQEVSHLPLHLICVFAEVCGTSRTIPQWKGSAPLYHN